MRVGLVFVVVAGMVGCAEAPSEAPNGWVDRSAGWGDAELVDLSEARDVGLSPDSVLSTPTSGVAFDVEGLLARVGMSGVTCNVDPATGVVTTDFDLPGDGETVVDSNGHTAVVSTDTGVYLHEIGVHHDETEPLVEVSAAPIEEGWRIGAAALLDSGLVSIHDDFGACSAHFQGGAWLDVPFDCPSEISGDRQGGSFWMAGRDGLWNVTELGGVRLGTADGVDWDAASQVAWTHEQTTLRAVSADGVELWAADLGSGILDVETLGDTGRAAVLVNTSPQDTIAIFEADGTLSGVTRYGETGRTLTASADGSRLALGLSGGIAFFTVE